VASGPSVLEGRELSWIELKASDRQPSAMSRPQKSASARAYLQCPHERHYWVYFLASKNRKTLYIGVTSDLSQRLREHRNPESTSEAFTTKYHTVDLVYYEAFDGIELAIARETQLKAWRREKKDALVSKMNPRWEDLSFEREFPATEQQVQPEEME
jgi:putative endonuclease